MTIPYQTGPTVRPFDEATEGLGSPANESEWLQFNKERNEALDDMLARFGIVEGGMSALDQMQQQLLHPAGMDLTGLTDTQDFLHQHNPVASVAPGLQDRAANSDLLHSLVNALPLPNADKPDMQSRQDLIDKAKAWNIPGAEQMPEEALSAMVQQYRDQAVRPSDIGMLGWLAGAAKAGGYGIQEALARATDNVPYIGESMSKMIHSQTSGDWVNLMKAGASGIPGGQAIGALGGLLNADPNQFVTAQEQLAGSLPLEYASGSNLLLGASPVGAINKIGYGIGAFAPSVAAWEAVGAIKGVGMLGKVGQYASPITRVIARSVDGLVQGGITAWLMEGGRAGSRESLNRMIAGSAAFGGAVEGGVQLYGEMRPAISALGGKVGESFATSAADQPQTTNLLSPNYPPDYEVLPMDRQLPSPVRALGAGRSSRVDFNGSASPEGYSVAPDGTVTARVGSGPFQTVYAPPAPAQSPVRALPPGPVNGYDDFGGAAPVTATPTPPYVPTGAQEKFLGGSAVVGADGAAVPVFHGTTVGFDQHSIAQADPEAMWGDGIYYTESPNIAEGYAGPLPGNTQPGAFGGTTSFAVNGEPQIRKSYLDIRNPLRLDATVEDGHAFIDRFADATGTDVTQSHATFTHTQQTATNAAVPNTYEHVHWALQQATSPQAYPESGVDFYGNPASPTPFIGRNGANEGLQKMGYDGLTHMGGTPDPVTGDPHRVWIAWDPTQVHPLYAPALARGEADGIAMTKQAEVMQSPASAVLVHQTDITNADVARAMVASRPGGVNVVADIGNLGETTADLVRAQINGDPMHYRYAQHPSGRIDLLASDSPIGRETIDQYNKHGMFIGQEVTTAGGKSGRIEKLGDKVTVRNPYTSDRAITLKKSSVFPKHGSYAFAEAPDSYDAFKKYALDYMAGESAKAGQPAPHEFDAQYGTMLPDVMNSWMNKMGYDEPTQNALAAYFNVRRVEDFKAIAPEEFIATEQIQHEADRAAEYADEVKPPDVYDKAETQGMEWVTSPGTGGGQLWDKNSSMKMAFDSPEEAETFLQNFSREVPDYSEPAFVPGELADASPGSTLPASGTYEDATRTLDNLDGASHLFDEVGMAMQPSVYDQLYGAIDVPPGFGGPGGGNYGGQLPPNVPRELLGGSPDYRPEFDALETRNAPLYSDLVNRYNGFMTNAVRSTRGTLQSMESDLIKANISWRPWSAYEKVDAAMKVAENEARPWQVEIDHILKPVGERIKRTGEFARLHEVVAADDRYDRMQKAGWSPAEVRASDNVREFTDRYDQYMIDRGIFRSGERGFIEQYIPHVRMYEGMNMEDPWGAAKKYLPNNFQFFADNMRSGGMTARQLDPRTLFEHYIRASHWAMHVAQPMAEMHDVAQAAGVPEKLSQYLKNWEAMAKTGYNIQQDMAVQGLKGIINTVGAPAGLKITPRQAAFLLNRGMSSMHTYFMGFKPHVWFRDAVQPLLAGIKGDMGTLAEAYKGILGSERDVMQQRAIEGGWAETSRPGIEKSSQFPGMNQASAEGPLEPTANAKYFTEKEQYVQEMFAQANDMYRDAIPDAIKNWEQGKFGPMYHYGKLQNVNRIIAGDVGYRLASKAGDRLQAFNMISAGLGMSADHALITDLRLPDGSYKAMDKARYLAESKLDTFKPAVQENAWRSVSSGDYKSANNLAGREMANETQFMYGALNMPPNMRSVSGRMFMQFGTFPTQFTAMAANGLTNGSLGSRVKFAAALGLITAGVNKVSDLTGWNLNSWLWVRIGGWAGGPLMQGLAHTFPSIAAIANVATPGQTTVADQNAAAQAIGGLGYQAGNAAKFGLGMTPFGPTIAAGAALFNTVQSYSHVLDQPNPLLEGAGITLTGPTARGSSWRQAEMQQDSIMKSFYPPAGQTPLPMEQHLPPIPGGGAIQ